MRDRRYSTQAWRRLRALVMTRDGGVCQVRGPRCTVRATTAHHIRPSSQYPQLFFDPTNLQAACTPCNRHGAVTQAENRVNRQTIAHLERVIEEQKVELDALYVKLAQFENGSSTEPARSRQTPRIF